MHASHETPTAVAVTEKLLERKPAFREFGTEGALHVAPKRLQRSGLQIFRALHRRRLVDQRDKGMNWQRHRGISRLFGPFSIITRAQRSHKAHGECAPPRERGRQTAACLAGAELQEAMTAIACEMLFEAIGDRFTEWKFIVGPLKAQNAMRRQNGNERERHKLPRFSRAGRFPPTTDLKTPSCPWLSGFGQRPTSARLTRWNIADFHPLGKISQETRLRGSLERIRTFESRDARQMLGDRPSIFIAERSGLQRRRERHCRHAEIRAGWPYPVDPAPLAIVPLRGFDGDGAWCRRNRKGSSNVAQQNPHKNQVGARTRSAASLRAWCARNSA
jgi:hypothetical protein